MNPHDWDRQELDRLEKEVGFPIFNETHDFILVNLVREVIKLKKAQAVNNEPS